MFLTPIFKKLSEELNLDISPVWGHHHVDRIDERIFNKIKESAAIILDVAHDRFNVGLETGYALALGKPIIAIREKPKENLPLPFDIATLNCYDYVVDGVGQELTDILRARLLCCVPILTNPTSAF